MNKSLVAITLLLASVATHAAPPVRPAIEWDAAIKAVYDDAKNCKKPTGWAEKIRFAAPYKDAGPGNYVILETTADDGGNRLLGPLKAMPTKEQMGSVKGQPICLRLN